MTDFLRAFWEGFTRPRLAALVGIFLVVFALAAVFSSSLLARVDACYLMAGPNDYGAELASQVMRLRRSQSDGAMMVVHVGSSVSQEAIDDPKLLTPALSENLGRPVHYWPLFMPNASLWDLGAMVDQVPENSQGYAVIEVNPGMLGYKRELPERFVERSETILDSTFVDEALRKAGRPIRARTGLPLVDHAGFFSARRDNIWRWVLQRPIEGTQNYQHRWTTETVRPEDDCSQLREIAAGYAAQAAVNGALLEKVVRLAESRGLKVILLCGHYRPTSLAMFPEVEDGYSRFMAGFAEKMGVSYIDPVTSAGLTGEDFYDSWHLWKRPARLRFQSTFVRLIGDVARREEIRRAS